MRVRVGAIGAAAGPGMTAAVDQPLLHHHSPGLVSCDRAGMGPARGRSSLRNAETISLVIPAMMEGSPAPRI